MKPLHILITGSHGQLGCELQRLLSTLQAEIGPVPSEYANAHVDYADLEDLDISDYEAVRAYIADRDPYDLVINGAAMANVDGCEQHEAAAFSANAQGPLNLARICAEQGAKLVQVSTDYVFSGTEARPRTEDDYPCPISAYGRTKLAGEALVLAQNPKSFVVRTAWLYGYVGKNFVQTMIGLGKTHDQISVVCDQMGNPTSANDLAYEILRIAQTQSYGIYHVTNEGTCSWFDFASAIMKHAQLACKVVACTSQEYKRMNPQAAQRPCYSSLENAHLAQTIGNEMRPWSDALASYFEHIEYVQSSLNAH